MPVLSLLKRFWLNQTQIIKNKISILIQSWFRLTTAADGHRVETVRVMLKTKDCGVRMSWRKMISCGDLFREKKEEAGTCLWAGCAVSRSWELAIETKTAFLKYIFKLLNVLFNTVKLDFQTLASLGLHSCLEWMGCYRDCSFYISVTNHTCFADPSSNCPDLPVVGNMLVLA